MSNMEQVAQAVGDVVVPLARITPCKNDVVTMKWLRKRRPPGKRLKAWASTAGAGILETADSRLNEDPTRKVADLLGVPVGRLSGRREALAQQKREEKRARKGAHRRAGPKAVEAAKPKKTKKTKKGE